MSSTELRRFDAESWVCVHCGPNSDVVRVTSNLADEMAAAAYANAVKQMGGFVFRTCKAGVLVAALQLIKSADDNEPTRTARPMQEGDVVRKFFKAITDTTG